MRLRLAMIIMFTLILVTIFAKYSDDFLIGDYSRAISNTGDTQVLELLEDAHFNYMRQNIDQQHDSSDLINFLQIYDQHGMDVRFRDEYTGSGFWNLGTQLLTRANYWLFEAEYTSEDYGDLDELNLDYWFYSMDRDDTVNIYPDEDFPGAGFHVLKCFPTDSNNPGTDSRYAIKDLKRREGMPYPDMHLKHLLYYEPDENITGKLKMTFNMKYDVNSGDGDVCSIGIRVMVKKVSDMNIEDPRIIEINSLNNDNIIIPVAQGINLHSSDFTGIYEDFEYEIDLTQIDSDYLETFHDTLDNVMLEPWQVAVREGTSRLTYLSPYIYYHDIGELRVNNIEIKDELFNEIDSDNLDPLIVSRLADMNNTNDNLLALYSYDEPVAPQFNAYDRIEDCVNSYDSNLRLETAIAWNWSDINQANSYSNISLFKKEADPEILTVDYYLWGNERSYYNQVDIIDDASTDITEGNIQHRISKICRYYNDVQTRDDLQDIEKIAVVQTYGDYIDSGGLGSWGNIMLPPSKLQKAIMYLPLCYGFDGIITFSMQSRHSDRGEDEFHECFATGDEYNGEDDIYFKRHDFYEVGPIQDFDNDVIWDTTSQYNAIKDANEKILVYGNLIKSFQWQGSGTIEVSDGDPVADFYDEYDIPVNNLTEITVSDDAINYHGFVECGVYEGYGTNYFMLVNRRANFTLSDPLIDPTRDVESFFTEAPSQTVNFQFDENNFALIDVFNNEFYLPVQSTPNIVSIEIGPGDGILLRVARIVPEVVNSSIALENACIPYNTVIANGGNLSLTGSCFFEEQKNVTVQSGGSLTVTGTTMMLHNSNIAIEQGGSAFLLNGTTKLSSNSGISTNGELYIMDQELSSFEYHIWDGITCNPGSKITLSGSLIENAIHGILASGSDVTIEFSEFNRCSESIEISGNCTLNMLSNSLHIPENGTGMVIVGNPESDVILNGTANDTLKFCGEGPNSVGIYVVNPVNTINNSLYCSNALFKDLDTGIYYRTFDSFSDVIENTEFNSCGIGFELFGNGSIHQISHCLFRSCDTGIKQDFGSAQVSSCSFNSCGLGFDISNQVTRSNPHGGNSTLPDIYNCNITNLASRNWGIRVTNSSPRIGSCTFLNDIGISSANNSYVGISNNAQNAFFTNSTSLEFLDTADTFTANVNLENGHNDFYDTAVNDFYFTQMFIGSNVTINLPLCQDDTGHRGLAG